MVTGAFSYSGAAIARKLQAVGRRVRTLTGHPERGWVDPAIELRPLDFADPVGLVQALRGATTLYNTYWIRFADGKVDHRTAVANSRVLFHAACRAGINQTRVQGWRHHRQRRRRSGPRASMVHRPAGCR